MQVTPLIFNNILNKNYTKKSETTAVENRNSSSEKFFVDNRESYGRYIAFGSATSAVSEKVATLRVFLATEVEPFLAKHEEIAGANDVLHQQAETMLDIFRKSRNAFNLKSDSGVDFKELDIVAKHLSKPLSHERNIKEYEYLRRKSKKYFVSDDVPTYATSISDEMHKRTLYLDTFKKMLFQYHRTEKDIRNGHANLQPEKFFPELVTKYKQVQEASNMALLNTNFYNDIYFFAQKVSKFLNGTKPDSIGYVSRLDKYSQEEMPLVRSWMQKYETRLPRTSDNTQKAQRLLDENTFLQQEVDGVFEALDKRRSQITAKHINRFLNNHPESEWNKANDARTDKILARQDELNGVLWQRIEDSKRRFFANKDTGYIHSGEPFIPKDVIYYGENGDLPF